jgi:hypothetical protein
MEAHRSRRTRDPARKLWYAYYRQVRFARWLGAIRVDADPLRAFHDLEGPGCSSTGRTTPGPRVP